MVAPSKRELMMPRRSVAYEYTCVMYLAQQFEENMRVILFLGDQWDYLPELKLKKHERDKYKDDVESFLSETGTCKRLLDALEVAGLVKNRAPLDKVIHLRNELAHRLLVEAGFDNMDDKSEKSLIGRLHRMALELYVAVAATRETRELFEKKSEMSQSLLNKMMIEFGMPELARENPRLKPKKNQPSILSETHHPFPHPCSA